MSERPVLFCLHALGMSAREFDALAELLRGEIDVVDIDLPGFGGAPADATSVEQMTDRVLRDIRAYGATRWMLLGHSMGGKIATLAASRVLAGEPGLFGLLGIVLVSASPLEPEPMDEQRRERMIAMAAAGPLSERDAAQFVGDNSADGLGDAERALALADLRRTDPAAWQDWLRRGSREDWSDAPTTAALPALVIAGAEDGDLGMPAQRRFAGARFPRARFHEVDGVAHLLPLEDAPALAALIRGFWREEAGRAPVVPARWAATIASGRTRRRTRALFAERALADDPAYRPAVLTGRRLATLRAIADAVVPQDGTPVDLAVRVDAQLARGEGDGWRPGSLPPDAEAYPAALDALADLADAAPEHVESALDDVAAGNGPTGRLTPEQLAAWFEDACVDLVRHWVAHPATLARLDYDGFANGGDGVRIDGFQLLAAGTREAWEPAPAEPGSEEAA